MTRSSPLLFRPSNDNAQVPVWALTFVATICILDIAKGVLSLDNAEGAHQELMKVRDTEPLVFLFAVPPLHCPAL